MSLVFWESKENLLSLCIKAFPLWTALILAMWGLLGCGMVSGHVLWCGEPDSQPPLLGAVWDG